MGNAPMGKWGPLADSPTPGRMSGETRLAEAARSPMVEKPQLVSDYAERRLGLPSAYWRLTRTGRA